MVLSATESKPHAQATVTLQYPRWWMLGNSGSNRPRQDDEVSSDRKRPAGMARRGGTGEGTTSSGGSFQPPVARYMRVFSRPRSIRVGETRCTRARTRDGCPSPSREANSVEGMARRRSGTAWCRRKQDLCCDVLCCAVDKGKASQMAEHELQPLCRCAPLRAPLASSSSPPSP